VLLLWGGFAGVLATLFSALEGRVLPILLSLLAMLLGGVLLFSGAKWTGSETWPTHGPG
jgi:hypothetical protein